jgi:hypothetical protein
MVQEDSGKARSTLTKEAMEKAPAPATLSTC